MASVQFSICKEQIKNFIKIINLNQDYLLKMLPFFTVLSLGFIWLWHIYEPVTINIQYNSSNGNNILFWSINSHFKQPQDILQKFTISLLRKH